MKHIPLIRASAIQGFAACLEEVGASTNSLLAQVQLPTSALQLPELLLPFKQVTEFYEAAARTAEREHFGLMVGQRTQIVDLGAYGRLLCQSLTLHDAIHTGTYLIATYTSGERFWVEEREEQIWLCRNFVDRSLAGLQQADYFSVMVMINLIRMAAGSQWRPSEVHFATQATGGLEPFEPLSEARLLFDQKATAVVVQRSLLSLPFNYLGDRQGWQQYQDYEQLQSSAPAMTYAGSIRQVIATLLRKQQTDIQVVAEIVGMSVRSFQRQLHEQGLTYSRLLEQVRFEQSLQLLHDSKIKLTDIAAELGYTDAANFTRAFKRWTGVSPTEFRHLQEQSADYV